MATFMSASAYPVGAQTTSTIPFPQSGRDADLETLYLVTIIDMTALVPIYSAQIEVDPQQHSGASTLTVLTNVPLPSNVLQPAVRATFLDAPPSAASTLGTASTPTLQTPAPTSSSTLSSLMGSITSSTSESSSTPSKTTKTGSDSSSTQGKTSPTSTSQLAGAHSDNISKGALAGVAVGCFFLGLLAAALALWSLRCCRQHRRRNRFSSSATTAILPASTDGSSNNGHKYFPMLPIANKNTEKTPSSVAEPVKSSKSQEEPNGLVSPVAPSGTAVPVPTSSFTIKRKHVSGASASGFAGASLDTTDRSFSELRTQVKALFEQIEMHVDDYYSSEASNIQLTEDQRHVLQQIDSPHLPDSIIGLLPEAEGNEVKPLIKHVLTYAIFSRIGGSSLYSDFDDMFLPEGLASLMAVILPISNASNTTDTHKQELDRRCWWKHETVAMMDSNGVVKSESVQMKIKKLAWVCVRALEPWAVTRYGIEARRSHLIRIMEEAVEAGLRVFGESKGWLMWQWETNPIDAREAGNGTLVLFPGLDMRKDMGNGRAGARLTGKNDGTNDLSHPEVVLAPTMASI